MRLGAQLERCNKGGLLLQAVAAQLTSPLVQPLLFLQLRPRLQGGLSLLLAPLHSIMQLLSTLLLPCACMVGSVGGEGAYQMQQATSR